MVWRAFCTVPHLLPGCRMYITTHSPEIISSLYCWCAVNDCLSEYGAVPFRSNLPPVLVADSYPANTNRPRHHSIELRDAVVVKKKKSPPEIQPALLLLHIVAALYQCSQNTEWHLSVFFSIFLFPFSVGISSINNVLGKSSEILISEAATAAAGGSYLFLSLGCTA